MKLEEIQKLIESLDKSSLNELEIEYAESFKLILKKQPKVEAIAHSSQQPLIIPINSGGGGYAPYQQSIAPSPIAPPSAAPVAAPAPAVDASKNYKKVLSPMVGTYYRSPSPESLPYVKVGDTISKGKVLCIIEAMKLMNEIESDIDGKIVEILVENGKPVEYNQVLYLVE